MISGVGNTQHTIAKNMAPTKFPNKTAMPSKIATAVIAISSVDRLNWNRGSDSLGRDGRTCREPSESGMLKIFCAVLLGRRAAQYSTST